MTRHVVEEAIDGDRTGRFVREALAVPVERGALFVERTRRNGPRPGLAPVVLVHGYAQNRHTWHVPRRSFANHLADAGFDVFNADLRGAGRSRRLGAPGPAGFADHVERDLPRILEAALHASGRPDAFLVGHSLGAAVACAHAGRAPAGVRGVVAIAGVYEFARASRSLRALGAALHLAHAVAPRLLPDPVPTRLAGRVLDWLSPAFDHPAAARLPLQAWAPRSMEPEVLGTSLRRAFEAASLGVTLDLFRRALGREFARAPGGSWFGPFEGRTDLPLLVVAGAQDRLAWVRDSRGAYDRSPSRDKTLVVLGPDGPAFGHLDILLGRDAPAHVWPRVTAWMRERA